MPVPGEVPALAGELIWPASAALAGLAAGGLANSCISRLPRPRPWEQPLFRCEFCGAREPLSAALPIIGWLLRSGRCRTCRTLTSTQAPVVEAVTAVLWLLIAGASAPSARSLSTMLFVTALLVLCLIDLEHQVLPDLITLPGIALGVLGAWLPGWPVTLLDSALSAGVGYFAMMALAKAAEMHYGEEALGQGDWKLVAMLGAFLGSTKLLAVLLIGSLTGALIGLLLVALLGEEGRQRLPLGTFLGVGGILMSLV